jgi:hypothetical protein
MRKKLNELLVLFLFLALGASSFSQIYSPKDIITVYDPFTITFDELVLNTNDDEFKEHNYLIVVTITIGPEKIIKFFYKSDLLVNTMRNFNDDYWAVTFKVLKNNVVLIPSVFNIPNNGGLIQIRMEGYSNLSMGDETMMNQLSTSYVYCGSSMYNAMDQAYKYLASSPEINKPNNSLLTSAEVLQRNVSTRPGIFYLGNPTDVSYAIPEDPSKAIGTNLLIQGKKKIESKLTSRTSDQWNLTITKLYDVKIVQNEGFYNKIKTVFSDVMNTQKIDENRREGYISRCNEVIAEDLMLGRRQGVYLNDEAVKQFTYLMNFLKADIRAKSDTASYTNDYMKADEREALTYMEANIREDDYNLENQYIYDDFIHSMIGRGTIQKEIDVIRRYYQLK